ncbi:MAG: hypothetical protein JKX69_02280 [Rhodobacteraceae bacterium]|nr:hypothetical protein [Paracoccaceae bacterium]
MRHFGFVVAALGAFALNPGLGYAQQAGQMLPAEFPPSDYSSNQYIDSQGCAFIRAGLSGAVHWVPRLSRTREQMCNFQPTFSSAEVLPEIPVVPAGVVVMPPPAGSAMDVVTPAAAVVAAPVVTSITALIPAVIAPVAAPVPQRMTLAQACQGRSGIQPGLISSRTGAPVDCGPAAMLSSALPATMPQAQPALLTARSEPRRLTLAAVCAEMLTTGRTYINQATGQMITCAIAPVLVASLPPVPAAPMTVGGPASAGTYSAAMALPASAIAAQRAAANCAGTPYRLGTQNNGTAYRCGPQTQSPSGLSYGGLPTATLATPVVTASAAAPVVVVAAQPARPTTNTSLFQRASIPASNPIGASVPTRPLPGYRRVWDDGRVNLNRGLPAHYIIAN